METTSYQKAKDKMAIRRPNIPIITLNIWTELTNKKAQSRRLDQKQNEPYAASRRHLSSKDKYRLGGK